MILDQFKRSALLRPMESFQIALLEHGLSALSRLLPHIETGDWQLKKPPSSRVTWGQRNQTIEMSVPIGAENAFSVSCTLQRLRTPKGVGSISRTLDARERAICESIVRGLEVAFSDGPPRNRQAARALQASFDQAVISDFLMHRYELGFDPYVILEEMRQLAEQTYENKPLAFGILIEAGYEATSSDARPFPGDFLGRKRYRALSDGYYTAYSISRSGQLLEFENLSDPGRRTAPRSFFPQWCRDLALRSQGSCIAVCLTRHGDILILTEGSLRITYRRGRWQLWNHTHIVDLLRNAARVQRVPKTVIPTVVNAMYRAAVDVSFRRTGGMFVILRNRRNIRRLVRYADVIGHEERDELNASFDDALPSTRIQKLPTPLTVELAALDGAIVLANDGNLLAYGAVLVPRKRGEIDPEEGSRTKAAIGASNYGLVLKVSADGDMAVYLSGKEFFRI